MPDQRLTEMRDDRIGKLEQSDDEQKKQIHEFATKYALMAQAGVAAKEHIDELKDSLKDLKAELAAAIKQSAEWREKLAWRVNVLLISMLATTIGWIATLAIK